MGGYRPILQMVRFAGHYCEKNVNAGTRSPSWLRRQFLRHVVTISNPKVYVVCMPGKSAYPVLAVCPQVRQENPSATACQGGLPGVAAPSPQQEQGVVTAVTAGVGTSSSSSTVSGEDEGSLW